MYKKLIASAAFPALLFSSNAAWAQSNEDLLKQIAALEKALNDLKAQVSENDSDIERIEGATADSSDNDIKIKLSPGPSFSTADGSKAFSLDGRIAVDSGWVNDDASDLANASDIRYFWFGTKGKVDDWSYRFLAAFENDSTDVKDAFVAYNGFDGVLIQAGNFKEFNGIESMSGNLHTTLMERADGITSFRSLRNIGLAATFYGDRHALQLGIFGDDPGNTASDDEGHSYTGRFIAAPILDNDKHHILHLGVSGRFRRPDADAESVRFRARGDSHVINARLVDTGTITGVDSYQTLAGEAMYKNGPFAMQAEYAMTEVDRDGAANPEFDGGYVQASYSLTGDHRSYNVKNGTYGRMSVGNPFNLKEGGTGAWELAARYSFVNLDDAAAGILGGEMNTYTLGVNWHPNNRVRISSNYVINDTNENAATVPNDDPQYLMLRAQLDF